MITSVEEIENAIARLSREELARFRSWYNEFEADIWDRQFEDDVNAGKLDKVAEQAINDFKTGQCRER